MREGAGTRGGAATNAAGMAAPAAVGADRGGPTASPEDGPHRLAELLRKCERAVVLTGAGVSVPSGIPDFRSPGTGLWEHLDPMEVATIDAFRRDPDRFWRFYGERFASLHDREPSPAHAAIAELERRDLVRGVITQNVDRLHRRAGSRRLVEIHGSIEWSVCPALPPARRARAGPRAAPGGPRSSPVRVLPGGAQARCRPVRRDPPRRGARGGLCARLRGRPHAMRRIVA